METENQHISDIRNGDMYSFKIIFERYYPGLYTFVKGIVKDEYHAGEIAQNVFIRVWLKREKLDPHKNFNNYLYTLTRHEISDYFQSEERYISMLRIEMIRDIRQTHDAISSNFDISQIESRLNSEVDKMPPQRQQVFRLSRMEGLSNVEIAAKMNISKRTVERHLNIALKSLRGKLGDLICWLIIFIFLK